MKLTPDKLTDADLPDRSATQKQLKQYVPPPWMEARRRQVEAEPQKGAGGTGAGEDRPKPKD